MTPHGDKRDLIPNGGTDAATGDDSVTCGICGHETSVAMLQQHLVDKHGFDPEKLAEELASAPVYDFADPKGWLFDA
jgi:hypothetical protein